jgi:hypothetical protein
MAGDRDNTAAGDGRDTAAARDAEAEPEQQELAPLDGGERLERLQKLREDLADTGSGEDDSEQGS